LSSRKKDRRKLKGGRSRGRELRRNGGRIYNIRSHNSKSSMEILNSTFKISAFHEIERDYARQHRFTCKAIWSMERIMDEVSEIL